MLKIKHSNLVVLLILLFSTSVKAVEKREVPDYNKGVDDSITTEDVILAPFRAALYPFYLLTDYGIRRPVGALATAAEKGKWTDHYTDFFSFGPHENEVGVFPNFFYEFGFRATVGVHAYWRNFPNKRHLPQLWATSGGSDWTAFRFQDVYTLKESRAKFIFNASKVDRPDLIFYGVGGDTVKGAESRYSLDSTEISLAYEKLFLKESKLVFKLSFLNRRLFDGDCCSDLSVSEAIDNSFFPTPNGFNEEYDIIVPHLEVALGQRLSRPEEWYGARFTAFGEYNARTDQSDSSWTHYGGSLVGFKRLDNRHRMVTLGISSSFVDKQGSGEIPFHELPANDGVDSFLGFKQRRIIGESIISSSLEYKWPVWAYLDGVVHYSVGNTFGPQLEGFDFNRLRQSVAFGLRKTATFGPQFNFLIGLGSKTFEQGGDFTEGRFVIGGGHAF